jgi:hypothetical protein
MEEAQCIGYDSQFPLPLSTFHCFAPGSLFIDCDRISKIINIIYLKFDVHDHYYSMVIFNN